jgi:hypothetical protein
LPDPARRPRRGGEGRDGRAVRPARPPAAATARCGQSRVSLRWVTRWGRAASAPRRSTLFAS